MELIPVRQSSRIPCSTVKIGILVLITLLGISFLFALALPSQAASPAPAAPIATCTSTGLGISVTTIPPKDHPGDTFNYTTTIHNTGDCVDNGINVYASCPGGSLSLIGTIATIPGGSTSFGGFKLCTVPSNYTSNTFGPVSFIANGTSNFNGVIENVTASTQITSFVIHLGLDVSKVATAKVEASGTIDVSSNVTNTGDTTVVLSSVVDNKAGNLTCAPIAVGGSMSPGASTTCTGSYTAPATPGSVNDTVNATITDQTGTSLSNQSSASTLVIKPGISVVKTCSPPSQQSSSGTITWTIVTNNTGNTALNVQLVETFPGLSNTSFVLAAGASNTTTFTSSGLSPGSYTNNVTATGTDQTGQNVSATSSATCTITPPAQITRTQGYWATHLNFTTYVFQNDLGSSIQIGTCRNITTVPVLMGGFWANIAKTSTGQHRSLLDQDRMILMQQLLAAILNNAAFGSSPGAGVIQAAGNAYCGTNTTLILSYANALNAFNSSGDNIIFPPGTPSIANIANPTLAKKVADISAWDVLP